MNVNALVATPFGGVSVWVRKTDLEILNSRLENNSRLYGGLDRRAKKLGVRVPGFSALSHMARKGIVDATYKLKGRTTQ